jgi:saccharopine dehydrogenase-like NADP-dependent oxidoreductase
LQTLASTLVTKGENNVATAMSKTVGLPLAIAAKNILAGDVKTKGVAIPVVEEIYKPILTELKSLGVDFVED